MNILVCIKQVPDTTEIKIDPVKNTLIREGVPSIVNPFDGYALEAAARIKDRDPAVKIVTLSMGPEQAKAALKEKGGDARVVSMPSFELFDAQDEAYKESVLPKAVRARVAVEAASPFGWYKYAGLDGEVIALDHFGASAPASILFKEFGFTVDNVVEKALAVCK